jgi:hypothetical protein
VGDGRARAGGEHGALAVNLRAIRIADTRPKAD